LIQIRDDSERSVLMRSMPRSVFCTVIVGALLAFLPASIAFGQAGTEIPAELPDSQANTPAKPAIVPHFHLSGLLSEAPLVDPFGLTGAQMMSLRGLTQRLQKACADKAVEAVVLTFDRMSFGMAQLEELRAAINDLKQAGKPVHVHVEGMSTGSYALLCAGSRLSMAPQSTLWLMGLYGESPYIKGLLDKIGVQADFMHMGDYKSAAEMMTRTGPSMQAQENINWYLDSIYGSLVDMIAQSRNKTGAQVRDFIDQGPYLAEQALARGLIDAVETRQQFLAQVKDAMAGQIRIDNRYGQDKQPKINLANPFAFFSILSEMFNPPRKSAQKDAVALIYVEGAIVPGHGQPSPFGMVGGAFSGDVRKALELAAQDDSIKAVVMRVNSPGGSAEASEVILNAARLVQTHKPLVISMGDVAGSGGYYIACAADSIFANENTITASIGVVGGKLVTQDMWHKLGINWVGYKRGANADILTGAQGFTDAQKQNFEQYMRTIYDVFKGHVEKGRGYRLRKPIDQIAGGRVYTGKQALDLGLVDYIGGLQQALDNAAAKASLEDYDVRVIPRPQDFVTQLMEQLSGEGQRPSDVALSKLGHVLASDATWKTLFAALHKTDPQRARVLYQALQRIDLIGQEGVILMMPHDVVLR
jgi:protease IV